MFDLITYMPLKSVHHSFEDGKIYTFFLPLYNFFIQMYYVMLSLAGRTVEENFFHMVLFFYIPFSVE